MDLKQLHKEGELSSRAFNFCLDLNAKTVYDLAEHMRQRGGFLHLRNCGTYTNSELIKLTTEYLLHTRVLNLNPELKELSVGKLKLINNYIKIQFKELSVRAQNGIKKCTGNRIEYPAIKTKLLRPNSNIHGLPNIGKKSANEIIEFLEGLSEFISILKKSKGDIQEKENEPGEEIAGLELLKMFVWQNGRWPDSEKADEKDLFEVYQRAKKSFEEKNLPEDSKVCFEEILSLL